MKRLARTGLIVLAGAFVAAIANAGARLTWTLSGQTGEKVSDIATALAEPRSKRQLDLSPVFALAPFGSPVVEEAPEPEARKTELGLVLRGIVIATPARASIAVIASKKGETKIYGAGDSIDGKATLKEILPEKVILTVNGRTEFLTYPDPDAKPSGVANIVASLSNTGVDASTGSVQAKAPPLIEDYRQRIIKNPKTVLDNLGLSVSQNGYTVDENARSGMLRAGFKSGDLISKVNGQAVGDIEKDRDLMDRVIASGRARIEVERNGRTVILSFPLQ